jgi:hypothetical protein
MPVDGLLQLSDVYGAVDGPRQLDDVDVVVETVVGNSGRFADREFRVDAWPDAMTYLASHIVEVRDHQAARLEEDAARLGVGPYFPSPYRRRSWTSDIEQSDHKVSERAKSVGGRVVEVVLNHAPRTKELAGRNGSEFYAGLTDNGVIFYAQAPYLRDLRRDGRVIELHRVKNEDNGGLWPDGHQFRSAEVANTRSIPASRELVYSYGSEEDLAAARSKGGHGHEVPEQGSPLRVVWVDKFGNVVLRLRDPEEYSDLLEAGEGSGLALVAEGREAPVDVGRNLDAAQTGIATIFRNPRTANPRHIDLAVKSEDCLSGRGHALEYMRGVTGRHVELRDLRKLEIDLKG